MADGAGLLVVEVGGGERVGAAGAGVEALEEAQVSASRAGDGQSDQDRRGLPAGIYSAGVAAEAGALLAARRASTASRWAI